MQRNYIKQSNKCQSLNTDVSVVWTIQDEYMVIASKDSTLANREKKESFKTRSQTQSVIWTESTIVIALIFLEAVGSSHL